MKGTKPLLWADMARNSYVMCAGYAATNPRAIRGLRRKYVHVKPNKREAYAKFVEQMKGNVS